jgi:hypothetical protein
VGAGLPRKKERDEDGKKDHVSREPREEKEADLVEQFAGATMLMLPVIVAPTAASTG